MAKKTKTTYSNDFRIVVMDNRYVLLGNIRPDPEDFIYHFLDCCHVIRQWGTTGGLGQLAIEGPLATTKLDYEGDNVEVSKRYVMRIIPCGDAWNSWQAQHKHFQTSQNNYRIVVMDNRYTLLGRIRPDHIDYVFNYLDDCHVIRQWGTTGGLGQLAIEGPQETTKLDYEGDNVQISKRYIMRIIPCSVVWDDWNQDKHS